MTLNQVVSEERPWGIVSFDSVYKGLPSQTFNLLRTGNKEISFAAIGHFIKTGLDRGERVAIVSFDHPNFLLDKYKEYGFSFAEALASEQLMYFYYKSRFSYSLSFATSYKKIYEELGNLAKRDLDRIVFLYADVLFNLETHLLAKSSVERILASFGKRNSLILGCYQAVNFRAHNVLDEVGHESLISYLELRKGSSGDSSQYDLILHRFPRLDEKAVLSLQLSKSHGFNTPTMELVNHG